MTEDIRSRHSWGARYPDGDLTLSGLALEVFVHHSVTTQLSPGASVAAEEQEMRQLEAVGQSRFSSGISYNVVIFPSGRAYQGVSFHRRGTHTGGRNSKARSICLAGNYETHKPTDAQIATAHAIYDDGQGKWWRTRAPLRGHRDVSQTACPGRHLYSRIDDIRDGGKLVSNPKPTAPKPGPKPGGGGLVVDGRWGSSTTWALQDELGTPADGRVSSQALRWRDDNPGLTTGWDWTRDPRGSQVITALQARIGAERDGVLGPDSIRRLQRHLGVIAVDGEIWNPSATVKALQRRLNAGRI
ncbi:N-acetylmuramoyl-L-alanine amidase [Promicromonospora umidemergens]|uniref:N-acetylmuramoyl-L-alanine amidase n=1 Tax=Promicromonospora umidemergens TaxID=629679 RepID=A0ABP8XK54_9MICO|nr:peptidoglycan recognition family protein [Promicromonospora umidemergens]MCP2284889.1 N-acetylmuramoyl-L-alanine amidase [Promicromonospora umidemergens]